MYSVFTRFIEFKFFNLCESGVFDLLAFYKLDSKMYEKVLFLVLFNNQLNNPLFLSAEACCGDVFWI